LSWLTGGILAIVAVADAEEDDRRASGALVLEDDEWDLPVLVPAPELDRSARGRAELPACWPSRPRT
jgi:hypothetical protein